MSTTTVKLSDERGTTQVTVTFGGVVLSKEDLTAVRKEFVTALSEQLFDGLPEIPPGFSFNRTTVEQTTSWTAHGVTVSVAASAVANYGTDGTADKLNTEIAHAMAEFHVLPGLVRKGNVAQTLQGLKDVAEIASAFAGALVASALVGMNTGPRDDPFPQKSYEPNGPWPY